MAAACARRCGCSSLRSSVRCSTLTAGLPIIASGQLTVGNRVANYHQRTSVRAISTSTEYHGRIQARFRHIEDNSKHRFTSTWPVPTLNQSHWRSNVSLVNRLSTSASLSTLTEATTLSSGGGLTVIDGLGSTVAEPTLASLGLGGMVPSGLVQSALEMLHISLDVPWWAAIVIGTVCVRLAIFPLVIIAQRNAANMHNNLPTMTRLQEKMLRARREGDLPGAIKASTELTDYMKRNGVNPFKNMLPPLAQVPIFMSVFFGIREMASLPVESMKTGGLMWFTDLTVADPYYALPLLTAATLLATIEVGVDGIKADQMQQQMRFVLRVMPFICFPFISQFPAAMLCYWFTSNAISLIQVLALKLPGVKPFFKIPALVQHDTSATKFLKAPLSDPSQPKMSFMESLRTSLKNAQLAAQIEERRRYDALEFKESSKTKTSTSVEPKPSSSTPKSSAQTTGAAMKSKT